MSKKIHHKKLLPKVNLKNALENLEDFGSFKVKLKTKHRTMDITTEQPDGIINWLNGYKS